MKKDAFLIAFTLATGLTLLPAQSPPDKSGVKPSVISLPTGAGSIEGLGESFEPQLNTGGSSYGIAIAAPPGRAGLTPSLRLAYDSYAGNGLAGIGWNLDLSSIKRQTDKGFPEYDSGDTFVHEGEELVPLNNADGDWRCENERQFKRLRQIDSDADGLPDAWEVTDRDGTRRTFGRFRGQNGRWSVVENPDLSSRPAFDRTYQWMLDSTIDVHGNRIEYEYLPGNGVLYPSRISYGHLGGNVHEVLFQYEIRGDAFDDYRATFSTRLEQRLTRLEVRSRGQLVRAYNLAYAYQPGDLTPDQVAIQSTYVDLGVTLLKRVVQVDRSGSDANFLPPLIFTYSGLDLTKAQERGFVAPPDLDLAEPSGRVQLADLDGDALPDLFSTPIEGAALAQRACLNRGEVTAGGVPRLSFAPSRLVQSSSPVDLALPDTVVHDPKGKGLVDLSALLSDGPNKRLETFGNRARLDVIDENRLGFSQEDVQSTVLENPPAFVTYSDAGTRQMDINFDKRGDFVNLQPGFGSMQVNTFYVTRGGAWTARETQLPPTYPLANTFDSTNGQANPCVHLADMNGDRMLDLLCLRVDNSAGGQRISVSYWPLTGLGRYGDERALSNMPGDTFDIGDLDLRDVFVDDFTGDGLSDVLVIDGTGPEATLMLRVNIAGRRWSTPYVRTGLPRYAPRDPINPTVLRMADLNANGSVDLLFRNTSPANTITYLELLPQGRPSVLNGIDNSLGKRTTIVYGSAAEDEQLARQAGNPWRTFAPFALEVVRQIRTTSGQDLNGDGREDTAVSEFRYRDPYYDGFEREFRGFSFAQRVDYGDDFVFEPATGLMNVTTHWNRSRTPTAQVSGPSLVSRFRFHTGSADQADNDDYGGNPPVFRLIDEVTEAAGHEEEPLKGMQWVEEIIDPVVLHSALDGGFDAGCEGATVATSLEGRSRLTPDTYVYSRTYQDWVVRRLYRPTEALPYVADQNADGVMEDYRTTPSVPIPAGRFATQGTVVTPGNGRSVSFPYISQQVTEVREANGLLSTTLGYPTVALQRNLQKFDYDDYGNQTSHQNFGLEAPGFDDERFVSTTYVLGGNALALWIINKPDVTTVTDESGAFVAKTVNYYDGAAFVGVQGQVQTRGLISRVDEFIDATRSVSAKRVRYDSFGNIEESRDPVGNVRLVTWDPVFRSLPVTETMVVGGGTGNLSISVAHDYAFGLVTNSVDFNGNVTSYQYDSFGRLVRIVRPGDTAAVPTSLFEYQPTDPVRGRAFVYDAAGNLTLTPVPIGSLNRVIVRQREIAGQPGEYTTITYSDGAGRKVAIVEEGEVAGTWVVREATSYNLRGKPQSKWLGYQISSANIPDFPQLWPAGRPPLNDGLNPAVVSTDLYYDPTGREIKTVAPPETWGGPRRETANAYVPARKLIFDEEDRHTGSPHESTPFIQYLDGLNRIIAVEEHVKITDTGLSGPPAAWRTEYVYDLNDQLTRVKDSQGNVKTMSYDGLRRMTDMNDPDRGKMTFLYDNASNLKETIDAKGQHVVYTYDGVNRVKTEDYLDGGPRSPDVEYFYDTPVTGLDLGNGTFGMATHTRGQTAYVRDLSGESHFSYDSRARIAWEVRRIPDRANGNLVSFRTRFAYDSSDRLTLLTYPDGDELSHTYNSRNLLQRLNGSSLGDVVRGIRYMPSGQLQTINYGNGVASRYVYDPRQRMTDLESTNSLGARLLDYAYSFDGAGNIQRIDDQRNLFGQPQATNRFNSQLFTYDDLYRLTRTDYPRLGSSASNHVAYTYDRIGNMLSQTSDIVQEENGLPVTDLGTMASGGPAGRLNRIGRQAGDPPGPHALTQITGTGGSRNYVYDANGNVTEVNDLNCQWDFKNRLVAAENGQMRALYTYDFRDRRVTKSVHWKQPGPDEGTEPSPFDPTWRSTTTHYINRYYEVREHDTAVKYVWNGSTRVARVTGFLGATARLQHLRLTEGWNLVSSMVGGQFPVLDPAVNTDIGSAALLSNSTLDNGFVPITASTPVQPGAVMWIHARRDMNLFLTGTPGTPSVPSLTGASQFIGNVFGDTLNFRSLLPDSAWMARYDAHAREWRHSFPNNLPLQSVNDMSPWVAQGGVIWTRGGTAGPLPASVLSLQVRYYHQDHLGSTAIVTDQSGALVEETSNYAFGQTRHDYRPAPVHREAYGFIQKERDVESGLDYFEARYFNSLAGRFASVDPLMTIDMKGRGQIPQTLNTYSYSVNNPVKYVDPTGLEVTAKTDPNKKGGETTTIKITGVVINESSTPMTDAEVKAVRDRIVTQMKSSFTGSDGNDNWSISVDLRIVKQAKDIKAKDHVIRIVDVVDPHDANVLGEVNDIGGKEVKIKPGLISKKPSDPGNASLERTSAHELGHTLGLRHDTDPDNPIRDKMQNSALMRQTQHTDGTDVNIHEIKRVQKLYDDRKLNQ